MTGTYRLRDKNGRDEGILRSTRIVSFDSTAFLSGNGSTEGTEVNAVERDTERTADGLTGPPIVTLEEFIELGDERSMLYSYRAILDGGPYTLKAPESYPNNWYLREEVEFLSRSGALGMQAGILSPARVFERELASGYKDLWIGYEDWGKPMEIFSALSKEQAWTLYRKLEFLPSSMHANHGSFNPDNVLYNHKENDYRFSNFSKCRADHDCLSKICPELRAARLLLGLQKSTLPSLGLSAEEAKVRAEEVERLYREECGRDWVNPGREYNEGNEIPPDFLSS